LWAPGCGPGELLGLRAARVDHTARRVGVLEVRYEAGIPARVIDELMGHAGGRPGGEFEQRGSLVGLRYRWTTPGWRRVVDAIEQRLAVAFKVAEEKRRWPDLAGRAIAAVGESE
jgi:hypothetical protein